MRKTMLRRGLAWLLVLVMTLSAVPFGGFAEEAPQGEGTSQEENGNPPVCTCAEQAKCTGETVNTACPVCAAEGADLDKCCLGETQPAQEDGEKPEEKSDEEKAAEAAKKASEEAVKNVQEKINALPAAEDITAENREAVEKALTAIDEAKEKLTDEERGKLDLTNYKAAADALKEMPAPKNGGDGNDGPANSDQQPKTGTAPQTGEQSEPDISFTVGSIANVDQLPIQISSFQFDTPTGVGLKGRFLEVGGKLPTEDTVYILNGSWSATSSAGTENAKTYSFKFSWEKQQNGQTVEISEEEKTGICGVNSSIDIVLTIEHGIQGIDPKSVDELNGRQGYWCTLDKEEKKLKLGATDGISFSPEFPIRIYTPATVTFHANAGGDNVQVPSQISTFCSETVDLTKIEDPVRPGYVFRGWSTGNGEYAARDMVTAPLLTVNEADVNLYALWIRVDTSNSIIELDQPLTKEQCNLWMKDREHYHHEDTVEVCGAPTAPKPEQETKAKEVLGTENVWLIGFDIGVTLKIGETIPVTDTQKTIRLIMPMKCLDFGGKLTILRTHDGEITEIPKGKPQNDIDEGWYQDSEGKIHLAVRYFSDYAVAYVPYTVSFDPKGGSSCLPETTLIDGTLDSLPTPTRADYAFEGWYLDAACTGAALDTTHVYTADTTVYAKWKLTTDVQALIDALPDADTVTAKNWRDAEKQLDPVRETVNGLEPEDRAALDLTRYNALAAAIDEQETQERKRPPTKAELLNGGIEVLGSATPTGWDVGTRLRESAKGSGILAVVMHLTKDDFKLRKAGMWDFQWGTDSGVAASEKEMELDTRYGVANLKCAAEADYCIYVDTRNYNEADGTGLTLWLASAELPYTISFDSNGGSSSPAPQQTDNTGKLTALPDPGEKTGYAFDGWYHGSLRVDENTAYIADTELTAHWHRVTYTVTFDGNGGKVKNSRKTTQDVAAAYGADVTPPEFVRDYYTLTAWARNADGTGKVSTPIKDLTEKDGDKITLYAVWEYAPRTVTFDADGGKITENKQTLASVTRTTQEDPINTLKATDLPVPDSREGWFFGGWYTQKDGKGDLVKAGSTEFKTDSTVYAYWIAFEPVTVTLKCRQGSMTVDGKNVTTATMQTKWPGVLDGTMPTPARTGYKFLGWYTAAGIKVDENTVFPKDTTLYARWVSAVSSTGNPRTGDQVRLGLAVGILAVAAVGLTAAIVVRKRKK